MLDKQRPAVDAAVSELQAIYQRTFFPYMKARWRRVPGQHRPPHLRRLFPLPRRPASERRRPSARSQLHHLSHDHLSKAKPAR